MARRLQEPVQTRGRSRGRDGRFHPGKVTLSRFENKKVDREWLKSNFPCMMACPAGTDAGRYVSLISRWPISPWQRDAQPIRKQKSRSGVVEEQLSLHDGLPRGYGRRPVCVADR